MGNERSLCGECRNFERHEHQFRPFGFCRHPAANSRYPDGTGGELRIADFDGACGKFEKRS